MSIFEILITSEYAFEVISCFFIRHCPLKQIIQRGIKEPFVNKQILGYVTVFYGYAKHLYRYARLILEKFIGSFLHAVVIAAFLGETKVLPLSCFCMQGESKRQSALLVGNGQQK